MQDCLPVVSVALFGGLSASSVYGCPQGSVHAAMILGVLDELVLPVNGVVEGEGVVVVVFQVCRLLQVHLREVAGRLDRSRPEFAHPVAGQFAPER